MVAGNEFGAEDVRLTPFVAIDDLTSLAAYGNPRT